MLSKTVNTLLTKIVKLCLTNIIKLCLSRIVKIMFVKLCLTKNCYLIKFIKHNFTNRPFGM